MTSRTRRSRTTRTRATRARATFRRRATRRPRRTARAPNSPAGSGKSDVGVAASIGVMYVDFETTAKIGVGANVDSTDTLTVNATNNFALQNLAVSGALAISGSAAVGGAIAVNIFNPLSTRAYIDSGTSGSDVTYVDAAKGMT